MKKPLVALALITTVVSLNANSTMSIPIPCPQKFTAKVKKIGGNSEVDGPLKKEKIEFEDISIISGEVDKNLSLELLRHTSMQLEEGQKYTFEMRNNKVCSINKI